MLLTLAPTVGLGRVLGVSALLPARTAITIVAAALGVLLALCCLVPRWRALLPIAVALLVVAAFNVPVVLLRGFQISTPATASSGQLRVLEWNTNGDLVSAATVARLASDLKAGVVVLPDARIGVTASAYRSAFEAAGLRGRFYSGAGADAQLAVFITAGLAADYPSAQTGPQAQKTLVLRPSSAQLPTIVALHANQPTPGGIGGWRDELQWVESNCRAGAVLVVGDFNASVDDFGSAGLGGCRDAAALTGAASVGTWPTTAPAFLGMPIDHALVTGMAGRVESFSVLTREDGSGARHRPTLTVLSSPSR